MLDLWRIRRILIAMWRRIIFALALALTFAVFGVRTYRFNHRPQTPHPAGLDVRIAELRFDNTPIEQAIAELSRRSGMPIDVD